jgi:excisionase family DNA binding protein
VSSRSVPDEQRLAYGAAELADKLGCSPGHIYNSIERGDIPGFSIGTRVFVPADAVDALVRRTRTASGVPESVEDPTALAAVGTILTNAAPVQPRHRPRGRKAVE